MKKYAVKKAPKIIISEMMNSSIPSVGASTREERCAAGGPWCSAWATDAASKACSPTRRGFGGSCARRARRACRCAAHALDQVGAQPAGLGLREGRDHDVVDAEVLQRVHDRRVRIRVADHARGVQPAARRRSSTSFSRVRARRVSRPSPPSWGTSSRNSRAGRPACLVGLALERLEQLVAAGGAVGDGERDVEREPLGVDVRDHVRHRQPGRLAHAVEQVAAQPARARLG